MNKSLIYLVLIATVGCVSTEQAEWNFLSFEKPDNNPVLQADSSFTFLCPIKNEVVRWQKADVFNPAAIVKDGKIHLLFRAEDNPADVLGGRTSRIGLATSDNGLHFDIHPTPVLYPDSGEFLQYDYPGGCEDPRVVVTEDGLYVMAYTAWNQDVARLSIAFSRDLIHWEKKGPAFAKAYSGDFLDYWSKSGSIITKMDGDQQVVTKIDGKYWMYWGERFINLAWSDDLAEWHPNLDDNGELKAIVEPQVNKFDSQLTECGPPAVITKEGIVLLYNGKNSEGDDAASELTGQYKSGTTFAEGLVFYKSKWFLYYGTADSFVGVAISN